MHEPTVAELVNGSGRLRRRQRLGRLLTGALGRPDIDGLDRIPAHGPLVLAINHRSMLDGPVVFGYLPRPVSCLVKAEAFVPWLAPLLRSAGQIPVARERLDPGPVRRCVQILRAGGVVGIFPEGTRGDGLVRTALPGVGYLALRSGASVLPVACHGTQELAHRRHLTRPRVRLCVGEPIAVQRYPDERPLNHRRVAETTETVRAALAALVTATGSTTPPDRRE